MKTISTQSIVHYSRKFKDDENVRRFLKLVIAGILFLFIALQTTKAQTGYLYVHTKALSEDLNQAFTFSVSGGTTTVPAFTLEDQQLNIEPTDIGAGHGTGSGELWIVNGATQGANGAVYHRSINSTTWNLVSGQTGSAIDGADLGHFVMVNTTGDAYLYNGSAFVMIFNHSTFSVKAVDIANNGSITSGTGYTAIVDANGHVWYYTGNYSTTFTWTDITPVTTSTYKFARLDVNPVTNDIVLTDVKGYSSKVNSLGGGLVYYSKPASSPTLVDIAVDDYGNVYAMSKDAQGMDAVYRFNGTAWTEEPHTGLHYFITCGAASQVWVIRGLTAAQSSSFASPSTIYTRVGDGSATWLDDERVQTTQNDNAIMIPVAPGTYTITEANVANWNLQRIAVYDSTAGSTMNVAGNSATVVVAAGKVVHVLFTNGLVSPLNLPNTCGTTTMIQNFGSGALGTRGNPLTGLTDFHYYNNSALNTTPDGYYSLTQNSTQWPNSLISDHSGAFGGYFMMVNASYAPNEFYRQRITNLVPGATYVLSFWAANLSPSSPLLPNILAGITDTSTGATLGSITTGNLPTDYAWHQYTFSFTATVTTGDIFLQNNALGGFGNDLALDDISLSGLCAVLPVTLVNFDAQKQANDVKVKWGTTSELNFDHFEVERSADAFTWTGIGTVAGNNDAALLKNYNYTDQSPLIGGNYYRLKEVDLNGTIFYSETKFVQFDGNTQWAVSVYPNPTTGTGGMVILQSNEPLQMIRVFDINGKLMMVKNIPAAETTGSVSYTVNTNSFAQGMYVVQLGNSKGNTTTIKLVKKD